MNAFAFFPSSCSVLDISPEDISGRNVRDSVLFRDSLCLGSFSGARRANIMIFIIVISSTRPKNRKAGEKHLSARSDFSARSCCYFSVKSVI